MPAPETPADADMECPADHESSPGGAVRVPLCTADPAVGSAARTEPRPADAARAALRASVAAPADAGAPAQDGNPSRPTAVPGGRPGDVAREALRAARREASRAEAEAGEAAVRGKRVTEPRTRRGSRATGGSADPVPHTSPASGAGSRAARVKAAQDMRHFLTNAFRMPAWSDTPEDESGTPDTDAGSAGQAYPDGAPSVPAPAKSADRERSSSASVRARLSATPRDARDGDRSSPEPVAVPLSGTDLGDRERSSSASVRARLSATPRDARDGDRPSPEPVAVPLSGTDLTDRERSSPEPVAAVPRSGATTDLTDRDSPSPASVSSTDFSDRGRPSSASVPLLLSATPAGAAEADRPSPASPSPHRSAVPSDPTEAGHPAPSSPYLPATMATPHRDTELRRTFPAFAPRAATAEGVSFAGTWWGNAWVGALEQGALDAKRVARGRGYADQGHVDAITVTPGLVLAYVRGSRPRPYRVQVRVRTLEGQDWERFLDAAADRPGHIAALLDRELPQSLADCGVPLLPGPGDLAPRCSCPDAGHPCKHAAALCCQTARLLDADPFVLLLLRGRGEKDLLDALSRRSAARAARAAQERQPQALPGVRAADALAPRPLPPLPAPLPLPPHPEQPPVYPAAPGGPDPFALDQLATDAAARAHALLGTGRDPVGELTLWQDAVRLAAARPGSGLTAATRTLYATLATAAGRTPTDLARAVAAWRQGGSAGLEVLEEPWDPPAGRFDRARPQLLAADLPAFRPWRNHLTHPHGHVQLRLGRDGLWYAYESEPGHDDWWPRGTPDLDPVGALTGLGTPADL
ncbi:SWIM zinc finger family protein [Streptomyces sp. NPDC046942]|uniref:SWIM zinc finger family protein n=1 Tax=Streptomyces sp. NPDC046942 TaxID=3155137 RepID=UPI0034025586